MLLSSDLSTIASPTNQYPQDHFSITFAPLVLDKVYRLADDPENGAIVLMSGMVRNNTKGRPVIALEYQAYEPMALDIFRKIAREIRQKCSDVNRVVIQHRTGRLTVGEVSVLVAVGSPHRMEAFAACQYGIDTLKQNAPIWKKEWFSESEYQWANWC
jgi:molybdopterin synthase catalytic subunit